MVWVLLGPWLKLAKCGGGRGCGEGHGECQQGGDALGAK